MNLIPVIGLEIHAELLTKTKIFCSCENKFGEEANTLVCPLCSGFPGTLPSLNKSALIMAIKAGLSLDCEINNYSSFDRKNYFYPDLPKAYQITQFYHPLCENGGIEINNKYYKISRIHLEEDAGKLIHNDNTTVIDYNRCGVPLIEIVTAPDFNSAFEVMEFVRCVALRLKYAQVCNSKLEEGSLRVDVNISLKDENSKVLGTRAEIKNLNSLKSIGRAIEFEIMRQSELIKNGEKVELETRRFDENTGTTIAMRKKESIYDYRYFPEPDLPTVFVSNEEILEIKNNLPKMPHKILDEYINKYGLSENDASLIVENKNLCDFYNEIINVYPSYNTVSKILLNEISRIINNEGIDYNSYKSNDIVQISKMYDDKKISKSALYEILKLLYKSNKTPYEIALDKNLLIVDDTNNIKKLLSEVINENESAILDYKSGNNKVFAYLMGQLIRKAGKSANPNTVKIILLEYLDSIKDE